MKPKNYNPQVTDFLKEKKHPHNEIIEKLRIIILSTDESLDENIKWNGPNYSINGEDRITMRLFPPKSLQLIFHCGAKPTKTDLKDNLIKDDSGLLVWKSNDRALINLIELDVESRKKELISIIKKWIQASK
ncbi:MAG TPA: DUF1801 domain-containing protein [Candidatus Gracilibacteria bacterium]|nr:DUF1801 domain-containing protein [Candidatus Gracilibacteria bacterium]